LSSITRVYGEIFKGDLRIACLQKKSKKGSETPKQEIDLIKKRLDAAESAYKETYGDKPNGKK